QAQEVEINRLKEIVKNLEDQEGVIGEKSGDDAPIKGRSTVGNKMHKAFPLPGESSHW
nr:hypothetical protein [Tanacetum cinerariifolium]